MKSTKLASGLGMVIGDFLHVILGVPADWILLLRGSTLGVTGLVSGARATSRGPADSMREDDLGLCLPDFFLLVGDFGRGRDLEVV